MGSARTSGAVPEASRRALTPAWRSRVRVKSRTSAAIRAGSTGSAAAGCLRTRRWARRMISPARRASPAMASSASRTSADVAGVEEAQGGLGVRDDGREGLVHLVRERGAQRRHRPHARGVRDRVPQVALALAGEVQLGHVGLGADVVRDLARLVADGRDAQEVPERRAVLAVVEDLALEDLSAAAGRWRSASRFPDRSRVPAPCGSSCRGSPRPSSRRAARRTGSRRRWARRASRRRR